ncbi:hypothetical protein ACLN7S_003244 [Escherichia coli]|nr:hypothetical protein [Escherichia coli]HAW7419835.1 hypothetical protein [Escherichia coli]
MTDIEHIRNELIAIRCNLIQLASEFISLNPQKNCLLYTDLISRSASDIKNLININDENNRSYLVHNITHVIVVYELYMSCFEKCPSWTTFNTDRKKIAELKARITLPTPE